jgi:hypothetical protein
VHPDFYGEAGGRPRPVPSYFLRTLATPANARSSFLTPAARAEDGAAGAILFSQQSAAAARSGFDINLLVAEYRALRASVLRLWIDATPLDEQGVEDVIRFNEAIDQAIVESVGHYLGTLWEVLPSSGPNCRICSTRTAPAFHQD